MTSSVANLQAFGNSVLRFDCRSLQFVSLLPKRAFSESCLLRRIYERDGTSSICASRPPVSDAGVFCSGEISFFYLDHGLFECPSTTRSWAKIQSMM
jgi:hypothetical protein